jgi:DNA-binding NarL/FixJ family response regulator
LIRVAIAEDHPEMRLVLQLLLRLYPEIDVIGEAGNGQEALDCVNLILPDVLVMDVYMPVLDGWKTTEQIVRQGISTHVILISLEDGDYMIRKSAEAGAKGFVTKGDLAISLRAAILAVHQGETFF